MGLDGGTIVAVLSALGVGGLLAEAVRQWFARGGRQFDEASTIRQELRERIRVLEERLEKQRMDCELEMRDMNRRLDQEQSEKFAMKLHVAILESKLRDVEAKCLKDHGGMQSTLDRMEHAADTQTQLEPPTEEARV
jgi:transposase-like protein